MKSRKALAVVSILCVVFIVACCPEEEKPATSTIDKDMVNQAILGTYSDMAIQNAVIAQHTLYPYHFVNNSADLNTIGQRDLTILIEHFKQNPGQLIVYRGDVDDLLHQSRAQLVYETLLQAGIEQDDIKIVDDMPGGDGMPSGSVIEILEQSKERPSGSQGGSQGGMRIQY